MSADPWANVPSVVRARLRARARSLLQEMGLTETDVAAKGIALESLGCLERPHERLPYEDERLRALGKKLFREWEW